VGEGVKENPQSPPRAATGQQPNAGTKPLAFTTDNKYVVKIGSEREEFTYLHREALNLSEVLVGSVTPQSEVKEGNLIVAVIINGKERRLTQSIRKPDEAIGERLVVTERLGEGKKHNTFTMDIKIGFHTKSGEQFELEGAGWLKRQAKKVEHNLKDFPGPQMGPVFHGSGWRGFDVDPKGAQAFRDEQTHPKFKECLQKIVDDLEVMLKPFRDAAMVFVGSSLFCFFDLDNPKHSSAKILDPDHPILLKPIEYVIPPLTLMTKSALKTQQEGKWFKRDWNEYKQRYKDSFFYGLVLIRQAFIRKDIGETLTTQEKAEIPSKALTRW